jgi:hypothetical protein
MVYYGILFPLILLVLVIFLINFALTALGNVLQKLAWKSRKSTLVALSMTGIEFLLVLIVIGGRFYISQNYMIVIFAILIFVFNSIILKHFLKYNTKLSVMIGLILALLTNLLAMLLIFALISAAFGITVFSHA